MSEPSIPNTFRLSPLSDPSSYISLNSNDSNAFLTSTLSLALVLYSQTLTPDPAIDFKICTVDNETDIYQPENSCLDQWGNNVTQATLQIAQAVTGQAWNRTWSDNGGLGGWTLRSEFAGPARRLAVDTDGLTVIMEEGVAIGQENSLWSFDDASDAVASATQSPSTSASVSATASLTTSATSASGTDDALTASDEHAGGLSSGALAGIVIGVLAFVLVVVAFLYMWFRRRRRQRPIRGIAEVDGTNWRQELASESTLEKSPAELQEVRRVELETTAPKVKRIVHELPT